MFMQAMACYSKWSTPVHQLPKNPEVVEERLRDIADNKDSLEKKMGECIGKNRASTLCSPIAHVIVHLIGRLDCKWSYREGVGLAIDISKV